MTDLTTEGRQAQGRPWPKVGPLRRFGPSILLVAAVVAAGTVATFHERGQRAVAGPGGRTAKSHHGYSNPADNPELPIFYSQAKADGTLSHYKWQTGCDTATGRLDIPSPYAPPCVPAFSGSNGGATAQGVTATVVKVVVYQAPPGDLTAALPGATDTPAETVATGEGFAKELNNVFELYGRHVQLTYMTGSGQSTDAVAAKADALKVGLQIKAFASIGGPAQTPVYEDELARLHVLCIACGLSVPYSSFQADAPYLWSGYTSTDTLLAEALDFVVGQLVGGDAVYAGDPAFHHKKRVIAIVHYDQNPPVFGSLTSRLYKEFAHSGLVLKASLSYLLILNELPQESTELIAKLKADGVTTVIFAGDPIMPIYLTAEAAKQDYYPEWVITGTIFTDTTTLGRLYNASEWAHAFGITTLAVPTPIDISSGWVMYKWYYGALPPARKTAGIILPALSELFLGIELAGPDLTPLTFEGGLFKYPPTGGDPRDPLIAFGYHAPPPQPGYSSPDDYAVIWYDPNTVGPNEEGVVGKGEIHFVNGGERFRAGQIPRQNLHLFQVAGSVTQFTTLSAVDNPNAPPWPGSPAALKKGSG
jgi:hypothetical protein